MNNLKAKSQNSNQEMGPLLKRIRTDKRFSMRELADRLGTAHSFIGKTEQLTRRLDVGEFIHYCVALEEDPVSVLKQLIKQTN